MGEAIAGRYLESLPAVMPPTPTKYQTNPESKVLNLESQLSRTRLEPYHPPYLNARHVQEDMRFYRDHRVKTQFVECEAASQTSFFPFKVWFGLKMMQDPDQSYDELAERFCKAICVTASISSRT